MSPAFDCRSGDCRRPPVVVRSENYTSFKAVENLSCRMVMISEPVVTAECRLVESSGDCRRPPVVVSGEAP
ncbi:hypothetical protein HAX54_006472, partial [Datura stramonium]|nr:hypothetical protein [Datura stramonium]